METLTDFVGTLDSECERCDVSTEVSSSRYIGPLRRRGKVITLLFLDNIKLRNPTRKIRRTVHRRTREFAAGGRRPVLHPGPFHASHFGDVSGDELLSK